MTSGGADQTCFDVVIIGGGINGASAACELSAAGYRVLLAEKDDLASGATSRSSRILHCGLRYFETPHPVRTFARFPSRLAGAIDMARAAMVARAELVGLKPEHCKPFTMCFPLYRTDEIRGWHLDIGLNLLARLGPKTPPLDYRRLKSGFEQALPFVPDLRDQADLLSIATYREYVIDWPDRLCVDAALEAERNGAELRLFTRAQPKYRTEDGTWVIELSGASGTSKTVRARMVLNLAGTWIDDACPAEPRANTPLVCGTKGAHIVVRLPERYQGYGIATLHRGGMPFYCLPLDGDHFYFGPTETLFTDDAGRAVADHGDIDFLLGEANHLLPGLRLTRSDVEFTWAGVRPLTYDPEQPMGRRTREIHDLRSRGQPGMLAMTAGPVMSYRSAGRELRDAVATSIRPSGTAPSAPSVSCESPAHDFADLCRKAVTAEHARDLKGILYTRTGRAWGRHLPRSVVVEAAESVADLLAWSPEDVANQVDAFIRHQSTIFPKGNATITQSVDIQ